MRPAVMELVVHGAHLGPNGQDLVEQAQEAERLGFSAFYVPDHPGSVPSPLGALSAIAQVTSKIRLGTNVLNVGVREPFQIAVDIATLDVISGGRAILGLGAGHTPAEWAAIGKTRPEPRLRVGRLVESATVIARLLAGETVDFRGEHVVLHGARIDAPLPAQPRIPLLIGGGNPRLLDFAGAHADLVGLTGLGRTLEDGHSHEVRWNPELIDEAVWRVIGAAEGRESPPRLEALVQSVQITDDRERAAALLAKEIPGLSVEEILSVPYLMLGSLAEISDQMESHQKRWGFDRFVIRSAAMFDIAPLVSGGLIDPT